MRLARIAAIALLGIVLVSTVACGYDATPTNIPIQCPTGYSTAVNDASMCCENGYPYYWSSDGSCNTFAQPIYTPTPTPTPSPSPTPTPTPTPSSSPTPTPTPGCQAGFSPAVNNPLVCCPDGYPYYWSDGYCHTAAELTPIDIPSGPTYNLTVGYWDCCSLILLRGGTCTPDLWQCDPMFAGGVVDPEGGTYQNGTYVTLTAYPAYGWVFTGWSGDVSGWSSTITVYMNSDKTIWADFDRQ